MTRTVETDVVIICVPTPLSKNREPDLSFVATPTESIATFRRRPTKRFSLASPLLTPVGGGAVRMVELEFDRSKPDGTLRKLMDSSRLTAHCWRPRIEIRDGLRQMMDIYGSTIAVQHPSL
ncbi:hypothetical protein NKH54_31210 [Mesorhizobium sp. M1004]